MEGRLYVKVRFICQGRLDLPKATIDHGTFVVPSAKVFVVDRGASTAAPSLGCFKNAKSLKSHAPEG